MTTAFVLSGGGSLGSIQVGMLLGLAESEITPDMIVGTSVGAMNGGWVGSRPVAAGIRALGRDSLNWPQGGGLKWPHLWGGGVLL